MPHAMTMPARPQKTIRFPKTLPRRLYRRRKTENRPVAFFGRPASGVGGRLAALFQQPPLLARPVALLFGLALVMQLLAATDGEQQLGASLIVEIDFQRHQRHAFALDALRE